MQYTDPTSRQAALVALGALHVLLVSLRQVCYHATIHGELERLEWAGSRIAALEPQVRHLEEDLGL